jgi:hypothetical protein
VEKNWDNGRQACAATLLWWNFVPFIILEFLSEGGNAPTNPRQGQKDQKGPPGNSHRVLTFDPKWGANSL